MNSKYKKGDRLYRIHYDGIQILLQSCYIKEVFWSETTDFSYWVQEGSLSTNESENNLFRSIEEFNEYFTEDKRLDYLSTLKKQFEGEIKKMNYYINEYQEKINRYESDPISGEGKKELMAQALKIEADRDEAKKHTPWLTFAAMAFQLAIVLLSASILAVDKRMFWGSIGVSVFGLLLLAQGIWLVVPLVI
jgi:hypothetical protein